MRQTFPKAALENAFGKVPPLFEIKKNFVTNKELFKTKKIES